MPAPTRQERRENRRRICDALNAETGQDGDGGATARVRAYRKDPQGAPPAEFAYVGGLALERWYTVGSGQPDEKRRASLWQETMKRMGKPATPDPGGWDGKADVSRYQIVVEGAIS